MIAALIVGGTLHGCSGCGGCMEGPSYGGSGCGAGLDFGDGGCFFLCFEDASFEPTDSLHPPFDIGFETGSSCRTALPPGYEC